MDKSNVKHSLKLFAKYSLYVKVFDLVVTFFNDIGMNDMLFIRLKFLFYNIFIGYYLLLINHL